VNTGAIKVKGLRDLVRDLNRISSDVGDELRTELAKAADPVKRQAEALALGRIRNMPSSPDWAEMRIGVARSTALVYMVPERRSRRRNRKWKRTNLADLLMERAMDPALEQNQEEVVQRVDEMLGRLGRTNGF